MSLIEFTKMQGLGNDFVVFDGPRQFDSGAISRICDRRSGVGADGVLVITPGQPIVMEYWNADDSPAEMCGNGLRCVARYAYDMGLVATREFDVSTPVGVRRVQILANAIEVELGETRVTGHTTIDSSRYHLVDVGNPHAVVEVDEPADADVPGVGARVEKDPQFENGTNVEFVRFDDHRVTMRVWERGVGETRACGTGMVAAAFVATKVARMETPITVEVPGGEGQVDFRDGVAWLTGPAEYSFTGVLDQG